MQTVKVYGVQDRRSTTQAKLPWVVRYTIDGRHRCKSFRTRIEADRYRSLLLQEVQAGRRFNEATGEPDSWQTPLSEARVHEWSRRWLGEQWQEWQPRTRASATEALARFITIAVEHGAKPPDGLRVYLQSALSPNTEGERDARFEKWMAKNCLTLGELDRERIADIDRRLGLKLDGSPLACRSLRQHDASATVSRRSCRLTSALSTTKSTSVISESTRSSDRRLVPTEGAPGASTTQNHLHAIACSLGI